MQFKDENGDFMGFTGLKSIFIQFKDEIGFPQTW